MNAVNDVSPWLIDLAVLTIFLIGIARFRRPESACGGNSLVGAAILGGLAMTLGWSVWHHASVALAAAAVGATLGWFTARRVAMTGVPAMIGFQNGAGGLAAALVAFVELTRRPAADSAIVVLAGTLSLSIGAVTFAGSMIAAGKLANLLAQRPSELRGHGWILRASFGAVAILILWAAIHRSGQTLPAIVGMSALALCAGVVLTIRVGGADMPVLISFLNALSGLAAAFCGVAIANRLLIACGATVAASGFILTHAMCRAMNRRWQSILLDGGATRTDDAPVERTAPVSSGRPPGPAIAAAKQTLLDQTPLDEAPLDEAPLNQARLGQSPLDHALAALRAAMRILFVPGYGMALAGGQQACVQLANRLLQMGKIVKFTIHPIAGRMPGHMHVLLAEADVDSDLLVDLDDINPEFAQADLAVIVGACDVVNPAAIHVPGTPISGMPILNAHLAARVLVCNLDLRPGYSGVDNPLYADPKTILLLGDARDSLQSLLDRLADPPP